MPNYRNNMPQQPAYKMPPQCTKPHEPHDDMVLAMAYVKWQKWQNIYDAEKGFCCGTIFQDLNLPFQGLGGCQK